MQDRGIPVQDAHEAVGMLPPGPAGVDRGAVQRQRREAHFRRAAQALALTVMALGVLVLAGWTLGLQVLKSLGAGMVSMKANTALCFLLAGLSLLLLPTERPGRRLRDRASGAAATVVLLVGGLTLMEYLAGWELGLDELLFTEPTSAVKTSHPGRMAPNTALCFVLGGIVLWLLGLRRHLRLAQGLAFGIGCIGLIAVLGYLYQLETLYGIASLTPMALHTALGFVVLAGALLAIRPAEGMMADFMQSTLDGLMVRRLLPAVLLVPIGLGWLSRLGEQAGLYDAAYGLALFTVSVIISFVMLVGWSARSLHRSVQQRQQAQAVLRAEHAFRAAIENSMPAGVAGIDRDGRQIYVNPAFCAMVGWEAEELLGQSPPFVYWPPDQAEPIQQALQQTLHGAAPPDGFELCFQRRDGSRFDAFVALAPLAGAHGETEGWLATVLDVTERTRSEAARRASEQRLRFTLEATRVGTWDWDLATNEVQWSDNLEALHGREPGNFTGSFESVQEDILPEDRATMEAAIEKALSERTDYHVQYRVRAADGRLLWVEGKGRAVYDDDGRPVRMTGICTDITALKQSQETLRLLAEASLLLGRSLDYQKTLNDVADLVVPTLADWCAIDLLEDGVPRLTAVAHPDPQKVALAHELRHRYPPPLDAPSGLGAVLRTGQAELYEEVDDDTLAVAARDDEHFAILKDLSLRSAVVVPLQARGRLLGALTLVAETPRRYAAGDLGPIEELARTCALAVDNARLYQEAQRELEERRRAEAELTRLNETLEERVRERTEQLEHTNAHLRDEVAERTRAERALERTNEALRQSNRELQEFAYVASHDLQEPLRKIHSFADLLEADLGDRLGEDGLDYLHRMQQASARMSGLIRDLLAFSRVKTRAQPFHRVDLNAVAQEVLNDLEVSLREADARVEVGPLPTLEAEPTQMRQLLQNLIGNALKFRRPGEQPVIHVRGTGGLAEDGFGGAGPRDGAAEALCRLEVQDNGIGFDEKYLDRIFSPFQRLHGRAQYKGTGMGLAICRRIAEHHHGTLTAHSCEGEGATFVVTLPVHQEQKNVVEEPTP